jgi:hypothetical protein
LSPQAAAAFVDAAAGGASSSLCASNVSLKAASLIGFRVFVHTVVCEKKKTRPVSQLLYRLSTVWLGALLYTSFATHRQTLLDR